uniref:SAP domain-containing protein n=1 Tax=viral metagenome TaxID=1070528 RepID=A0A6C0AUW7_9ZZZZ
MVSKSDISKLKKGDAISLLSKLNLPTSGNRPELLDRIRTYYHASPDGPKASKAQQVKKTKPVTTNTTPINSAPSKSSIQLMKKGNLIELCNKLSLSTNGNKPDLVSRLEEHYRPTNNKSINLNNGVPTKTAVRQMSKDELKTNLSKNNLSISGSRLELFNRLENFYRPVARVLDDIDVETSNDDIDVETSSEDDGPAEAAAEKETILQIIEYNDYKIGVCQDSGSIHELDESDGEWYRTKLVWDYEKACPCGF